MLWQFLNKIDLGLHAKLKEKKTRPETKLYRDSGLYQLPLIILD